ncbi:MAG: argininosuccinate lyase [Methanobacteriales archaeon Met13]
MNLRSGRFQGKMTSEAASYTSSLDFDVRIFAADVQCNLAHTTMLKEQGIISAPDADLIIKALQKLQKEGIEALDLDPSVEDIHMAVENYVTCEIGEVAGFMHTAKSRNDQVATDLRIALKEEIKTINEGILTFIKKLIPMAEANLETVMVGYTHLQHAQPTTFAHHLLSYAQALKRDYERLEDAYKRVDLCPLGSAALTTTSFPINRERTAELLGFSKPLENSIDAVSCRDFITETVFALTQLGITLSRICEELIIWSTYEFRMVEIGDEFCSTSSIMPQKKNPDVAEVARAKAISLEGELVTILSITKALPQSYNRDLQEVTLHLWNATDTARDTLNITRDMLLSLEFNHPRGEELARANFSTATELADLMVQENKIPFRLAHQIVGRVVSTALEENMKPEQINSAFLDQIARQINGKPLKIKDELVKKALDPLEVVKSRKVTGGPAPESVKKVISNLKEFLAVN